MPPRKRPTPVPAAAANRSRRGGPIPPRVATAIDITAISGRKGLSVGDRVTILGTGLYSGDEAVVERLMGSVIPAAMVRTTAGQTRQVRTVDLEPLGQRRDRPEA